MYFYNSKIGFITNYYNKILINYIMPYQHQITDLYLNKNKMVYSCLLIYPIFYKKVFFIGISGKITKTKKMKRNYNLNQTLIVEGTVSSNKCSFKVPLFSFLNWVSLENVI